VLDVRDVMREVVAPDIATTSDESRIRTVGHRQTSSPAAHWRPISSVTPPSARKKTASGC
jgi:hypothetical protein